MDDFRTSFTKWYRNKGYRFNYEFSGFNDGDAVEMTFHCPWWVRLMTFFFFSPSVYLHETITAKKEAEAEYL